MHLRRQWVIPTIHIRELDGVPDYGFQPGTALPAVVHQNKPGWKISLSLSLVLIFFVTLPNQSINQLIKDKFCFKVLYAHSCNFLIQYENENLLTIFNFVCPLDLLGNT